MRVEKVIQALGYKPNEARVYLAVLSMGEAHASDVAERIGLPRTSIQMMLNRLMRDGLVNFYVRRRYKYWVAENPSRLLANLQRREKDMRAALPELTLLRKNRGTRQAIDEEAKRGMEHLRAVADGTAQPVLIANENAAIEYVNAAWEQQFGYSLDEIRGAHPRMFRSDRTPTNVYEHLHRTLREGRLFQSTEFIDKRKDGSSFKLLTTIFSTNVGGKRHFVQVLDDLTERERVERLRRDFLRIDTG